MRDRKITLYSPLKGESKTPNPAIREELSEPVPAEQESDLPTRLISKKKNQRQLDKSAFVLLTLKVYERFANIQEINYWLRLSEQTSRNKNGIL